MPTAVVSRVMTAGTESTLASNNKTIVWIT